MAWDRVCVELGLYLPFVCPSDDNKSEGKKCGGVISAERSRWTRQKMCLIVPHGLTWLQIWAFTCRSSRLSAWAAKRPEVRVVLTASSSEAVSFNRFPIKDCLHLPSCPWFDPNCGIPKEISCRCKIVGNYKIVDQVSDFRYLSCVVSYQNLLLMFVTLDWMSAQFVRWGINWGTFWRWRLL
jgi:hypothetical protein